MSSTAPTLEASYVAGLRGVVRQVSRRWFTLYLTLFVLPFPFVLSGLGGRTLENLRIAIGLWLGRHVFGIEKALTTASAEGTSTDRAIDYIWLAVLLALATAGTLTWSLARPREHTERKIMEFARTYIRYVVGIEMLGYGLFKVIPVQFGALEPTLLTRSIGELPPMRMLWAFMAASTPYTIFGGAAEVLGACLLFSRRTMLLGALILIGVMTNVVLLNLCYDVPIKIKSSHLLACSIFLAAPAAERLWRAVMEVPEASVLPARATSARWVARVVTLLTFAAAFAVFAGMAYRGYESQLRAARQPLYGVWEVQAAPADVQRWQRVAIGDGSFHVIFSDAQRRKLRFEADARSGVVTLIDPREKARVGTLRAKLAPEGDALALDGEVDEQPIALMLKRKRDFMLVTRGFHWVNDVSIREY